MQRAKLASLLMLLSFFAGCASKPFYSSSEPDALIPLEIGNRWTFTELGNNTTHIVSVIKSSRADDNTWYQYNEFGDKFWLRNHNGYQYEATNAFDKDLPATVSHSEIVFYPPAKTPKIYKSSGGIIEYSKCKKPLSVPAGTFHCHIYRVDMGQGNYSINYYAVGIGLIRNEYSTDKGTEIYELSSYDIK